MQAVAQHFLKTPEGATYGPVDMATLCMWATDARIIPGCLLSVDRTTWTPVESHSDLRLNWSVRFDDGTTYGPLNLLAIWVLAAESSIPRGVTLVEKDTNRTVILDDSLQPLLVTECRQVLTGCSRLIGEVVVALEHDRRQTALHLADREADSAALAARLVQAERDLAVNMKLVAETQRHLSESGNAESRTEAFSREMSALRSRLTSAQQAVTDRESEVEILKTKLSAICKDLDASRQQAQEAQRDLAECRMRLEKDSLERAASGSDIARVKLELSGKDAEIRLLLAKASRFEAELKELQQSHVEESARAESAERSSTEAKVALAKREEELTSQKNTLENCSRQLTALHADLEEFGAVRNDNARLQGELRSLQTELDAARLDIQRISEAHVALQSVAQQRLERQSKLEGELQDSLRMTEAAEIRVRTGEETLIRLRSENDTLRKVVKESQGETEEWKTRATKCEAEVRDVRASAESQTCQLQSRIDALRLTLQNEQERYGREMASLSHLRHEIAAMTSRMETLQQDLNDKESVVRKQGSALADQRVESDRQLSVLRSKCEVLEKELQLSKQNALTLATQVAQAKESALKVQSAARVKEQKLKDEMTAIQSDLNGLILARQCVLDVSDKSKPAPIDWMGDVRVGADNDEQDKGVRSRTARLTVAEKLNVLQKELQSSAEQKELIRRKLESLLGEHELLVREASRKEGELNEKVAQLRGDLKTTSEQLDQAMREVEKRESVIRDLRRKDARGSDGNKAYTAVLDAEVIHEVNLGPDETREDATRPGRKDDYTNQARAAQSGGKPPERVLSSVEAQLQNELKKWEALKAEKEKREGTLGKWFRRKQS